MRPAQILMFDEPEYVDVGMEWGDEDWSPTRRPKWQQGSTDLQRDALSATGRKYWPDKKVRSAFVKLEKSAVPDSMGLDANIPREYIQHLIGWAHELNKKAGFTKIKIQALLSALYNPDNLKRYHDEKRKAAVERRQPGVIIVDTRER